MRDSTRTFLTAQNKTQNTSFSLERMIGINEISYGIGKYVYRVI